MIIWYRKREEEGERGDGERGREGDGEIDRGEREGEQ
jgi:hypothetical protein